MNVLCFIRQKPVNRKQERQVEKEQEKIFSVLTPIEISFLENLFNDDNQATYNDMYIDHLNRFMSEIKYLEKTLKPKFIKINKYYFHEIFYPHESC